MKQTEIIYQLAKPDPKSKEWVNEHDMFMSNNKERLDQHKRVLTRKEWDGGKR